MSLPDFPSFYQAIHGHAPFPWQQRAAARLASRQTFAVTAPTGLGKSSLVDAAVWAAAHGAWRRIVFVVDRRLVVDEVHERARRIQQALETASSHALQAVRERTGEIQVVRLRGGVFGDDDWVLYPERLSIVLTTVDQLGSRLLFRGYGVSSKRWPLHAGFFADDTLVIVDEAHLSNPFLQTLASIRAAGADIALIPMSATLGSPQTLERLGLDAQDLALPAVQQRLQATRQVQLQETAASDREFVKSVQKLLATLRQQPEARKIAVVVNRVSTARQLFDSLRSQGMACTLLTGRIRPVERDRLVAGLLEEIRAGRQRQPDDRPLIVVATQTIEVGADFDFDALISECAPLSALRQRFGRLDRLGQLGHSRGWILRRSGQKPDPVYGEAASRSWAWLQERAGNAGSIDFGLQALDQLLASHPAPPEEIRHAASLLPAHISLLGQTGPFAPQPDLTGWLHGPGSLATDVTLIWRDDLDALPVEDWAEAVSLLPPMLREGLAIPVTAARRFLAGAAAPDNLSDLNAEDSPEAATGHASRPVLRWRGADDCKPLQAQDIRPGDTLILPASYGGCDAWGWAADSRQPVPDLADACQLERLASGAPQRLTLRLTDGHWPALGEAAATLQPASAELLRLHGQLQEDDELQERKDEARAALLQALQALPDFAAALREPQIEFQRDGLRLRSRGTEELDDLIETGRPVSLQQHHADVARWAQQLSANHPQQAALVTAAFGHDAGKAEPRMQVLLHGHPLQAELGPRLAKSVAAGRARQRMAWQQSGLPRGFRHEFASLDYLPQTDALIRHLIATHHGHGRPWLRACADPQAAGAHYATLDSRWVEHWGNLQQEYGPWELARLEWRLRAADARASMEEARQTEDASA